MKTGTSFMINNIRIIFDDNFTKAVHNVDD